MFLRIFIAFRKITLLSFFGDFKQVFHFPFGHFKSACGASVQLSEQSSQIVLSQGHRCEKRNAYVLSAQNALFGFFSGILKGFKGHNVPSPEKLPYFVKFHIVASVKQLIGVILGLCCLGAEGEAQIQALRIVSRCFGIVEHNCQIAALPDFENIIGGDNILLCQFV